MQKHKWRVIWLAEAQVNDLAFFFFFNYIGAVT